MYSRYEVLPFDSTFNLVGDQSSNRKRTKEYLREVDAEWAIAQKKNNQLFNDPILYLSCQVENTLYAFFDDYKFWYTQRHLKNHHEKYYVLAVTGVIKCSGKYLMGQRSLNVTQDQELYEFFPSGGLSNIGAINNELCQAQIEMELVEELYIKNHESRMITPIGMVKDNQDWVVDLVYLIDFVGDPESFKINDLEHDKLLWLNYDSLIFSTGKINCSPISEQIIKMLKV